jgi:hypothetical protein
MNGRLLVELSGETTKEIFAGVAAVQEVFEAEISCGCCNGTDLRVVHRTVDDYHYYEMRCTNPECRARFQFGQQKKGGGLFPKRKGEDEKYLPHRGWAKFVAKRDAQGAATPGKTTSGGGWAPDDPRDDDVPF